MKKNNKTLKFKTIAEEAKFWDTHDASEFILADKPLDLEYSSKKVKKDVLTLRVSPKIKAQINKIADSYDISSSSLVRMWIVEKVGNFKVGN